MKNTSMIMLTVSVILFTLIGCSVDPVPCPFQTISFVEENEQNQHSIELSNEISIKLKQLPLVPLRVEDVIKVSGELKGLTGKYSRTPIDLYLAGNYNTYLTGTVCNTFIMMQTASKDQKMYYDSLLRVQFARLTDFMEQYSTGVLPNPLPGCPPPPKRPKGDDSAILTFFNKRISAATTVSDRKYWNDRFEFTKPMIADCQKSDNPEQCFRELLRKLEEIYSTR